MVKEKFVSFPNDFCRSRYKIYPRFGDLFLSCFCSGVFVHILRKTRLMTCLSILKLPIQNHTGWRKYVKFRLSIVKQVLEIDTELQGDSHFSDQSDNNLINYF